MQLSWQHLLRVCLHFLPLNLVISRKIWNFLHFRGQITQYEQGYFYIEYDTHSEAALARRKLASPARFNLLGMEVSKVDWAQPETEVDEDIMAKVNDSIELKHDTVGIWIANIWMTKSGIQIICFLIPGSYCILGKKKVEKLSAF